MDDVKSCLMIKLSDSNDPVENYIIALHVKDYVITIYVETLMNEISRRVTAFI